MHVLAPSQHVLVPHPCSTILVGIFDVRYSTAIQDPTMSLPSGSAVGINGIHVHGSDLYYTNLGAGTFIKIPISLADGRQVGPAMVIFNDIEGDDFALSKDGRFAWIAANPDNTLLEFDIWSRTGRVAAGSFNSTDIAEPTAVAFGRTRTDGNVLYVVTAGGLGSPFADSGVTGGRVVGISLS
ncbi:hypothetical protein EDB81DRAFT_816864 [Dactylonectria macrodidyma]|uniref:SMP-30/Gluconolactonase/LRE-like region domain-containing protein n=1 Tax=Dactylonectria macrodidyma TaxID=307937 RepID=A0A9P9IGD6_9HYPO|nr:hypothetical protein EDB81DRAFT_816864 [Dactylonectria macrodidyma]